MALRLFATAALVLASIPPAGSAQWVDLIGKNLDQWESIGDGLWTLMRDGTIVGQRRSKSEHQAWLYTKKDFGEFDLHLEWWTRFHGNSGVSIRDTSRAKSAVPPNWDRDKTPSHIGYEIQISNGYTEDKYPSGSIYLFAQAKTGFQVDNDWNSFDIESRNDVIRVMLNGRLVCEHPGEPGRPKVGPIGLQLHDPASLAMFRNIRVREIGKK